MDSQSEILFHEIINVQKILIDWLNKVLLFSTENWADQLKKTTLYETNDEKDDNHFNSSSSNIFNNLCLLTKARGTKVMMRMMMINN